MDRRNLTAAEANKLHHTRIKCERSAKDFLKAISDMDADHDLDVIVTCALLMRSIERTTKSRENVPAYPTFRDRLREAVHQACSDEHNNICLGKTWDDLEMHIDRALKSVEKNGPVEAVLG